jgi:hypothetical protein
MDIVEEEAGSWSPVQGFRDLVTKNETPCEFALDSIVSVTHETRLSGFRFAPVLLLEKKQRFSYREVILPHYFQMHTAGVFLVGIGIAAAVAIFAASKQARSLDQDSIISHSSRDDDASH